MITAASAFASALKKESETSKQPELYEKRDPWRTFFSQSDATE
jgi:hypothetical protein